MNGQSTFDRSKWWSFYDEAAFEATIIAEVFIPQNVTSLPFVSSIDLKKIIENKPIKTILKASLNTSNHLVVNQHIDWIPLLRLASNCEEQNVEVCFNSSFSTTCAIFLKTIKPIKEGEELKVWFSSDLLALLEIPFLTPVHIVNHQVYKCSNCSKAFGQPNPLKVHIAYDCPRKGSRLSSSDLNCDIRQDLRNGNLLAPTFLTSQVFMAPNGQLISHRSLIDPNNNHPSKVQSSKSSDVRATKEPKTHVCVFCGKLYTRKYGLKIHLRTHTGHKPLSCRFCGRPFSDPSNLNKHIRLHAHHAHAHHNHFDTYRNLNTIPPNFSNHKKFKNK